jgi:hypothetical protein
MVKGKIKIAITFCNFSQLCQSVKLRLIEITLRWPALSIVVIDALRKPAGFFAEVKICKWVALIRGILLIRWTPATKLQI